MAVSYYDALLPVREPGPGLLATVARLRPAHRVLASVCVPGGRIVVAFLSDSARLSRMFAANWAQAGMDQEPDATLYALTPPARCYGLDGRWDAARWWSRDRRIMVVFGLALSAGQGVRPGHLLGRQRGRHVVPARMRGVCRRGGRPPRRDYHREFRGGEDHAGGRAAAASGIFNGGAERRLGRRFAGLR